LLTTARRLHHLVMGAGTAVDEAVAKYYRGIKDNLRHPVRLQLAIPAMGRNELREFFMVSHAGLPCLVLVKVVLLAFYLMLLYSVYPVMHEVVFRISHI
jgi:hypothetical protein